MKPVHLFTDGGSRGNPGPAAIAWRIEDEGGSLLDQGSRCIGSATNNEAEYRALIHGLEAARALGAERVAWSSDSQLVVRQMKGTYHVRSPRLLPLFHEASALAETFAEVTKEHLTREDPRIARVDLLVNEALDGCSSPTGPISRRRQPRS